MNGNPPHPGEFLSEVYLKPYGLSYCYLAKNLDVSPSTLSRLLRDQSAITPEIALRLSKALGRTPESWLKMQDNYSLWIAKKKINLDTVKTIDFSALPIPS